MRQPRAWDLPASPLSGCLELGGSPPEEGDPVLLIGGGAGGTYLGRSWYPLREAGSPQQARHQGEPQEHPPQEPGPYPHPRTALELAQKDIVGLDQVGGDLSG